MPVSRTSSALGLAAILFATMLGSRWGRDVTSPEAKQGSTKGTANIEVHISTQRRVVRVGDSVDLRVEISNTGADDVLLCKDFVSQPCGLRVDFQPSAKIAHEGVAADCVPYELSEHQAAAPDDFARILVRDWVSVPPRHFYGGTIRLSRGTYPELGVSGSYRISVRFNSGGLLGNDCYTKLRAFSKQISELPTSSWTGSIDSNSILIHVK